MTRPVRTSPGFDWAALSAQVQRNQAALDPREDPEALAHLLRQRAAALAARPTAVDAEPGGALEVLAFACAGERYAFETRWVERALPMQPLTPIPGVPAYIAGIAMVEGEVVAVLDLRVLLALPLNELAEPGALVVLHGEGSRFAVLADSLAGVCRLPQAEPGHGLPALAQLDRSYLRAVAPDRTAVLDARRLLADSTLVVYDDR